MRVPLLRQMMDGVSQLFSQTPSDFSFSLPAFSMSVSERL